MRIEDWPKWKVVALAAVFGVVPVFGCNSEIVYRSEAKLPDDRKDLLEWIAGEEVRIEGLEVELSEAKESRDAVARVAESTEGYFEKDGASVRLSRANSTVEWVTKRLTFARSDLAKAKARLENLEE